MKLNLLGLQFATFYRSIFPSYRDYAKNITEIFFEDVPAINDIPNFNMTPDDFPFYNLEGKNGFRIIISKSRTDIVYNPIEEVYNFDSIVDMFSNKIEKYIKNTIDDYTLSSRIGFIAESFYQTIDANKMVTKTYFVDKFLDGASDINIIFNKQEQFKNHNINKITNIESRKFLNTRNNEEVEGVYCKKDINTREICLSISKEFIIAFLNNYKKYFYSTSIKDMLYVK